MWKQGNKYSEKNHSKSRRLLNSSKEDENKKGRIRSSCYNCWQAGHYRPECPKIKKENKKDHHKRSRKSRRVYVAWES